MTGRGGSRRAREILRSTTICRRVDQGTNPGVSADLSPGQWCRRGHLSLRQAGGRGALGQIVHTPTARYKRGSAECGEWSNCWGYSCSSDESRPIQEASWIIERGRNLVNVLHSSRTHPYNRAVRLELRNVEGGDDDFASADVEKRRPR